MSAGLGAPQREERKLCPAEEEEEEGKVLGVLTGLWEEHWDRLELARKEAEAAQLGGHLQREFPVHLHPFLIPCGFGTQSSLAELRL